MGRREDTKGFDTPGGRIDISVTQLPPMRAFRFLARMVKALGPTLGDLVPAYIAAEGKGALGHFMKKTSVQGFGAALAQIDVNEMEWIIRESMSTASTTMNGKRVDLGSQELLDAVFDGALPSMLKAVWFSLQVNFGNFSELLPAASPDSEPKPAEAPFPGSIRTMRKRGRPGVSG